MGRWDVHPRCRPRRSYSLVHQLALASTVPMVRYRSLVPNRRRTRPYAAQLPFGLPGIRQELFLGSWNGLERFVQNINQRYAIQDGWSHERDCLS